MVDMETSTNLTLSEEMLNKGEVKCDKCNKGFLKPFNPNYAINHSFQCDYCGERLIIEPNIEVQ